MIWVAECQQDKRGYVVQTMNFLMDKKFYSTGFLKIAERQLIEFMRKLDLKE